MVEVEKKVRLFTSSYMYDTVICEHGPHDILCWSICSAKLLGKKCSEKRGNKLLYMLYCGHEDCMCEKKFFSVGENFSFSTLHNSVEIAEILSHSFRKNFVKAMVLLKKLLNSWFDEKNFREREFLVLPHCMYVKVT